MDDASASPYLQKVLALDPVTSATEMLRMRREHLAPDDLVVPELTGESSEANRAGLLNRLYRLREEFWRLDERELRRELECLRFVANPEIAIAATRLLQVAEQRNTITQLRNDRRANGTFINALVEILVAPSTTSNVLREREHGWMRPEQNAQHLAARQAIVSTINHIRGHYPTVYALEETWLNELLAYNPEDEKVDDATNTLFGLGLVGFAIATLVTLIGIVSWIFA